MQIVLPSGSEMKAILQTGVGKGSILNFTPFAFNSAMAASKSSISKPTDAPSARGMQAALPYVDLFAPAHNLASLAALEPYLARI